MSENFIELLHELFHTALSSPSNADEPIAEEDWTEVWEQLDLLQGTANSLSSAANIASWIAAAIDWHEQFLHLATLLASFRGIEAYLAVEDLLVRVLKDRQPTIATILNWLGLIYTELNADSPGEIRHRIDWEKLVDAILDSMEWFSWNVLFFGAKTNHPDPFQVPDPGRASSVLSALTLMAPESLPMVLHGDLQVAPIPFPHVHGDPDDLWVKFRTKSSEWVSATLVRKPDTPDQPGDPVAKDRHLFHLVDDPDPEKTLTIGIRSNRYQNSGGEWVSDFEFWLYFRPDQEEFRLPDEGASYVRIAPATLLGLGYDGAAGTWNSYMDPNSAFLPARADDPAVIEWVNESDENQPDILIGSPYDSHLSIKELGAWIKLYRDEPYFAAGATAKEVSVVIMPSMFGAFKKFIRDGIRFDLDFEFSFVQGVGLTLNQTAGLEALAVLNLSKWGITLHSLRLIGETKVIDVTQEDGSVSKRFRYRAALRIHFSLELWKFIFVVDGAGVWYGLWGHSNPEVWGIDPWLSVGVGIQDENIQGGGFLYRKEPLPPVREEFGGLIHLKIRSFEVVAFGIYKEMVDGTTTFIMILGVRFQPGIALPFGLQLQGIGGLIGINRRADTDRLWQRLTIGTVGSILTVDDPLKNAPIILGDLDYLFPDTNGVHLFGPTFRLIWLKQVQLDLALIVEIATSSEAYGTTGLTKIVVLGVARLERKVGKHKLLDITLNLVGVLDLVNDFLAIDAVLHKSKVLDIFKASGTAAVRMSWGKQPYLMLTLGGFHPKFNPEPAVFPKLDRVALAYAGKGSSRLKVRAEGYVALTSNSYQTGYKLEAKIDAGRLNAEGTLAFDALIQLFPFYFDVSISAKVRVRYKSRTLAGISLEGRISGPGPFTISGKFCIEILFFDICWSGTFTLGDAAAQIVQAVASLLDALAPELQVATNLESDGVDDRLVIINTAFTENDKPVLPPIGGLVWSQRRAPLNCLLDRFEGLPLALPEAVVVSTPDAIMRSIYEWFSPGSFSNLDDSEALNQPAFERLESGIRMGLDQQSSDPVGKNVDVFTYYLPEPRSQSGQTAIFIPIMVEESLSGRSAASAEFERKAATVRLRRQAWTVRDASGSISQDGLSQTDAHRRARLNHKVALRENDVIALRV